MAYIYLEELKKILPGILDQWIDKDDECWEWIFQEIEQKCHVGKKKKDKKPKKKDMQNAMEIAIMAHRNDINELTKKVGELNEKVDNLGRDNTILSARISTLASSVEGVKWIAQTAKQRTEVDYSKYSGKSDGKIGYGSESKCCATCKYGGTGADVCVGCAYEHWEAKENE